MRYKLIVALASLFAGALLSAVYWVGLHGGFLFDDGPNILQEEGVRLATLSLDSIHQALTSGHSGPSGRPVAQLSFALNHYFSGFDPFVFKATNLAIHLICGFLVFSLARHLLTTVRPAAKKLNVLLTAGVVTALWLLHPIQLLPILHVVQRMTSLSALFLLGAMLAHIRGRELSGRAGTAFLVLAWVVLWPLSFFSKETGALFPLFVLAWELIVRRSSTSNLDRFAGGLTALTSFLLLAGVAYTLSPRAQWLWSGYDLRTFSLVERLLTEGRVLWFYLELIVVAPMEAFGLYHDDIVVSTGLFSPWTTLPALFGLAGLIWLAWRIRTLAPLSSFGIAWFLIGNSMESTVLPLEIAHEHRNYLPLFGILLIGAWALLNALERKGVFKTIGIGLATAALAYFLFITTLRAHQFGDEVRRTQIEAQHHRTSARAQYQAGLSLAGLPESALSNSPIHSFARSHFELANKLDPSFKLGWLGLIHLNCKAGIPVDQAEINELARRLRATPLSPGDRTVMYSLKEMSIAGTICLNRQEIDSLFAAVLINPSVSKGVQSMLQSWHADYLWLREHDVTAALGALGQSLTLNPSNLSNRLKWAQLIFLSGDQNEAKRLLLELRDEDFSTEERKTLKELLATYNIVEH